MNQLAVNTAPDVNNRWITFIRLCGRRLATGLSIFLITTGTAGAENVLNVAKVEGSVQLNEAGRNEWKPLSMDTPVGAGDRIRVSGSAACNLGWETFGSVVLRENTIAEVREVKEKTVDILIEVGQAEAVGTGTPGRILVVSTAFAQLFAKKAAAFSIYVTETQVAKVTVTEGVIIAKAVDVTKPRLIKAGFLAEMRKGFLGEPEKAARSGGTEGAAAAARAGSGDAFEVLSLIVPEENEVFSTTAIEVTGAYRQQGTVLVNGKTVKRAADGAFSTIIELPEGYDTVTVVAKAPSGAETRLVRPVLVNTFLPVIDLFLPAAGPYVNRADYRLRGVLADDTPYDEVHVLINGAEVPHARWGFSHVLVLEEGWNGLSLEAVDLAENFALLDTALFLDTQMPEVILYQPRGQDISYTRPPNPPPTTSSVSLEYYRVEGRVIDPEPSSGILVFNINSVEIPLDEDGGFSSDITLRSGAPNRLFIMARDRAGNEFRDESRVLTY